MDIGKCVLVVDDNPDNRELVRILMEAEGYHIFAAEDAAAAMDQLKAIHPGLILMDIQLPGMDGLELTRRLRGDAAFEDVVIVALTACERSDEANARVAGCDGYLAKPIDTRTFSATVGTYLRAGRHRG